MCEITTINSKNILIIQNFPLELIHSLNSSGNPASEKHNKGFNNVKFSLIKFLSENINDKCVIFYWEDGSDRERLTYIVNKFFGDQIIGHYMTNIFYFYAANKKNLTDFMFRVCRSLRIVEPSKNQLNPFLDSYDINLEKIRFAFYPNFNNLLQGCGNNDILYEENGNYYSKYNVKYSTKFILPKTHNSSSYDFFHFLGKLLYNKRLNNFGEKVKMVKKQLLTIPKPKFYEHIPNMIDYSCHSYEDCTNWLQEGVYNHYKDIRELSYVLETFSHTDLLKKFKYKTNSNDNEVERLGTILNCMSVVEHNLSQYQESWNQKKEKENFDVKFQSPMIKNSSLFNWEKQNEDKTRYYQDIEKYPSLSQMSMKRYRYEIEPFLNNLKKTKHSLNNPKNRELDNSKYTATRKFNDVAEETENINFKNSISSKHNKLSISSTAFKAINEYTITSMDEIFENDETENLITQEETMEVILDDHAMEEIYGLISQQEQQDLRSEQNIKFTEEDLQYISEYLET